VQYTHLGRTGVAVSRLCLGTMNFGCYTSEEDSFTIMTRALELGINFIDTANSYGWLGWIPDRGRRGLAEEIIGRWLSQESARRDQIVLATKVYTPMSHEINDRGLSAYHIRRACEDSLRRLQTDHIDIYYMHHIDRGEHHQSIYQDWLGLPERDLYRPAHRKRETPWEEIWQAMEVLVRQGKVLYVGSSNFAGWNIAQACEKAKARNSLGLVCEQSPYNLCNRMVELEVIPACREYGLGLVPYSPLAGGWLAGILQKVGTGQGRRGGTVKEEEIENRAQLEAYEALCRELGEEPASVALAWPLRNPVVTAPVIGPRTVEQLTGSLRALEIDLDDDTLNRLDEIWPGPGGEAPEAYTG
jgi:aryl-alcohol dehydrogenase-like predicted oxidoreductase